MNKTVCESRVIVCDMCQLSPAVRWQSEGHGTILHLTCQEVVIAAMGMPYTTGKAFTAAPQNRQDMDKRRPDSRAIT